MFDYQDVRANHAAGNIRSICAKARNHADFQDIKSISNIAILNVNMAFSYMKTVREENAENLRAIRMLNKRRRLILALTA